MDIGYRVAAFAVLALHGAFVLWVFAGGFFARRLRRWFRLHLASIAWGIFSVATGFPCPLTRLENHFRDLGGLVAYTEECILHYVWIPLDLPRGPVAPFLLVAPAVALNGVAYRPRHRTPSADAGASP